MKWIVKTNGIGILFDEFNSKKEAEKCIKTCKEKDAKNGISNEYTICLRSIN